MLSPPFKLTAVKIGRCSLVEAANAVWSTRVLKSSTLNVKIVPFSCKSISGYSSGLIEFNLKFERKSDIWAIVSSITSNEITSPSIFLTISVKYLLAKRVEPSSQSFMTLLSFTIHGISVLIVNSLLLAKIDKTLSNNDNLKFVITGIGDLVLIALLAVLNAFKKMSRLIVNLIYLYLL